MDLRQLRTFQAVAELGSLSKAADRVRLAQPALSRHIKLLEHELRTELFVRTARGMVLTSAGRKLLDRTTGLVREIEQVRDDIQSAAGAPSGRVVLGLVPTVSAVLSGRFARRVVSEFPQISLCIVESFGGHLVDWLHRGQMDIAVIYGPGVDLHLPVQPIGREDLVAIGPPGCGLQQREYVELEWLVSQKLVLPSFSHGLRALIEKAVARKGLALNAVMEADSYRVQVSLVEEGLGYSVLPPSSIRAELQSGRLEAAAIGRPSITRELILASPAAHPASIATTTISTQLFSEFQKMADEKLWAIKFATHE
jgi:LysR family transcriptional regulator, nitrogen assimilation regulatory protein